MLPLPDLGEGLASAVIVEWFISEGEEIAVDQSIALLETVKVTTEIPSPWAGRVVRLCARAGQEINVGEGLLVLETDATVHESSVRQGHLVGTPSMASPRTPRSLPPKPDTRIAASPLVRRLARKLGVDLRTVTGTGANGSITLEDVQSAAQDTTEAT